MGQHQHKEHCPRRYTFPALISTSKKWCSQPLLQLFRSNPPAEGGGAKNGRWQGHYRLIKFPIESAVWRLSKNAP